MIANIQCGFNAHPRMHAEIIGTLGVLEIADTFLDSPGTIQLHTKDGTRLLTVAESDRYGAEIRDFSACIMERRHPLLGLDETILNMEVLDMIRSELG
jgi:predicted dehydrogenase